MTLVELVVYFLCLVFGILGLFPIQAETIQRAYQIAVGLTMFTYAQKFFSKHGLSFTALGTELSAAYMLMALIFLTTPLSYGESDSNVYALFVHVISILVSHCEKHDAVTFTHVRISAQYSRLLSVQFFETLGCDALNSCSLHAAESEAASG